MHYYDENINRLPDDMIIDLYEDFQWFKSLPNGLKMDKYLMLMFKVSLSYSWHGWFRQKMIPHLR